MARLGLEKELVDEKVFEHTVARFREARIALPTFGELADPRTIPAPTRAALAGVDPDRPHPLNLYRVHWYNGADRVSLVEVPGHIVLGRELTGVDAPIVVALGNRFPMIRAHKVLAAYGCLVPRLVTGQFDPTAHKAIWPSTGNYCRGGVAVSRILGCRGVAVLPEGMSEERFRWLESWVTDPADIIRTAGTESNVKEIYDKCKELDADRANIVFNQFCEFGNHLVHYSCTGTALERVYEALRARDPELRVAAFVSATGSAGTIAAGDWLKEKHGSKTVAVEAAECPTMLENGFGEHNVQGIGDKHIPFIHNVMATDLAVAVSDESTDALGVLFNTDAGRAFLVDRKGVSKAAVESLKGLGLSAICNVLAAIKTARYFGLGAHEAVFTVATDDFEMYGSERDKTVAKRFGGRFDALAAAETYGQHLAGVATDRLLELSHVDRRRIFNLGYFTWVEQQGVSLPEFVARREPSFWSGLREMLPIWDGMVREFNRRTGAGAA
jgi:cysteine synthase